MYAQGDFRLRVSPPDVLIQSNGELLSEYNKTGLLEMVLVDGKHTFVLWKSGFQADAVVVDITDDEMKEAKVLLTLHPDYDLFLKKSEKHNVRRLKRIGLLSAFSIGAAASWFSLATNSRVKINELELLAKGFEEQHYLALPTEKAGLYNSFEATRQEHIDAQKNTIEAG